MGQQGRVLSTDPNAGAPAASEPRVLSSDPNAGTSAPPPAAPRGMLERFWDVTGPQVNPFNMAIGLAREASRPFTNVGDVPASLARGDVRGAASQFLKHIPIVGAETERLEKIWGEDTGSGVGDMGTRLIQSVPFVGENTVRAGSRFLAGEYPEAAGELTGVAAAVLGPKALGKGAELVGQGAQAAGRQLARPVMAARITDEARVMAGWRPGTPTAAVDRLIAEGAVEARVLPGFWRPDRNRASARMDESAQTVADLEATGAGRTIVPPMAVKNSGPVTRTQADARGLSPAASAEAANIINSKMRAETPAGTALPGQPRANPPAAIGDGTTASAWDIPRTAAETAGAAHRTSRMTRGTTAQGPAAMGPRMDRAISQGEREAAARAVRSESHPNSPRMASEIERQSRLAPIEEALANTRKATIDAGGAGTLELKLLASAFDRMLSPTARGVVAAGRGAQTAGRVLSPSMQRIASLPREELVRLAVLAQLQQSGGR